jgi:hypothetical protein
MGISMVPRIVLKTFPDLKLLSVHTLPSQFNVAPTVFIRRKGAVSPKVAALIEVLAEGADLNAVPGPQRKVANAAVQSFGGLPQATSPRPAGGRSKGSRSGKPRLRASASKTKAEPRAEARSPASR